MLPEIYYATNGNLKYALISRNDLISGAMCGGGFEVGLHHIANEILKNSTDGIVLDIGANLGSFTVPIASNHPHLQIYSFEPQRIIYYQLCTNILLNRLENVYAHHFGISDSEWTKQLEVPNYSSEQNVGAFSVDTEVRSKDYLVVTHGNKENITAKRLDTMQLKNIRLIKIDVEGHELEALQGASETIKLSNYPPIMLESWDQKFPDKQKQLFTYLNSIGYTISRIDHNSNYLATWNRNK